MSECIHCMEREAVCVGKHEGVSAWEYACDVCCGHGCEDGVCHLLEDLDIATVLNENDTIRADLDRARARETELMGQVAQMRKTLTGARRTLEQCSHPMDEGGREFISVRRLTIETINAALSTPATPWVSPEEQKQATANALAEIEREVAKTEERCREEQKRREDAMVEGVRRWYEREGDMHVWPELEQAMRAAAKEGA